MRIISKFNDYYDFAVGAANDKTFKEKVYIRNSEYKSALLDLPEVPELNLWCEDAVKSAWWEKNKKLYHLTDSPQDLKYGCLFVCGKAFPFVFIDGYATISADDKSGRLIVSKHYDAALAAYRKKQEEEPKKYWWYKSNDNKENAGEHFFKTYFSKEEFDADIIIEIALNKWRRRHYNGNTDREIKTFFESFAHKDYSFLHILLDCPIMLTFFAKIGGYEFLLNPNLYELGFGRIMSAQILYQEIEMFVGNTLVKDTMPYCYQSDLDKLTAHGFDAKTSFRKTKETK